MRISDWSSDVCSSDLCRLGHRSQLRLLRSARLWRDGADVRRRADGAGCRTLLEDLPRPRRDDFLYGANRDSRADETRPRMAEAIRSVEIAVARQRRDRKSVV